MGAASPLLTGLIETHIAHLIYINIFLSQWPLMNQEALCQKYFQLNQRTPKGYVGAVIDTAQQMP